MDLKPQPHNKDAEQYVLGAMCFSKNAITVASDHLSADDFYYPNHQVIFQTIIDLVESKTPVDTVILKDALARLNKLDDVGGVEYIAQLVAYTSSAHNIDTYVKIVEEKSLLRRLIATSEEIGSLAYNGEEEVSEILDRSEQMILSVVKKRQSTEFKTAYEVINNVRKNIEHLQTVDGHITGLPTNYPALDKMINGLNKNELLIVAARPAMGKSAFALNIAQNIALNSNKAAAIFSLEMGAEQLMNRIVSSVGQIDATRVRTGNLDNRDWDLFGSAVTKLSKSKIYMDDSAGMTVGEIRAKCRRLAAREDLGVVIIDYLQLITGSARAAAGGRQNEVSEISRMLKMMALELEIPVIALSQLSRGVESREDKRPLMSDLRESGSIEQDADIIMFLYRDDYYNKESSSSDDSVVEVIVSKNRSGSTGTVDLVFRKNYSSFVNRSYSYEDNGDLDV